VILHGTVSDAFALALEMAEAGRFLAHPYDDLAVIAGQGTVGLEVTEDVEAADVVVVPIGGGGLISGVATAVKAAWPSARVVGVEPLGAQTMTRALADGEPSAIEPDTIADGLSAPIAGVYTLAHTRALVDEIVVIGDEQIAAGMRSLAGAAKLVTEASGAAAVAALMAGAVPVRAGDRVVAVCSGGNIDLDRFAALVDS